jgi:hypothetical protein
VGAALLSVGEFLGAVVGMASAHGSPTPSSASTTTAAAGTPATTSTSTKVVTTTHAS